MDFKTFDEFDMCRIVRALVILRNIDKIKYKTQIAAARTKTILELAYSTLMGSLSPSDGGHAPIQSTVRNLLINVRSTLEKEASESQLADLEHSISLMASMTRMIEELSQSIDNTIKNQAEGASTSTGEESPKRKKGKKELGDIFGPRQTEKD